MPVKMDASRCCSPPLPFDCDLLSELDEELVNDCLSTNFDEIWNNLMPTPPASPNAKPDFLDFSLESYLDDNDNTDFDKVINHDCMWSGNGCNEGRCPLLYKPTTTTTGATWTSRSTSESQFDATISSLSTSPITAFGNDFALYDMANSLNESMLPNGYCDEQQNQQVASAESNAYAMANDHAYESSSQVMTIKEEDCEGEHMLQYGGNGRVSHQTESSK